MDWGNISSRWTESIKKYRIFLLVILVGLLLLTMPEKEPSQEPTAPVPAPEAASLEDTLSALLCSVEGAGRVEVLLTQAKGEEIVYQTDDDRSSNDARTDTVLVTGEDRAQAGLIRQKNPPVYLGAVILCQGADKGSVRLGMVEAVSNATGLTSDKITVLKMK